MIKKTFIFAFQLLLVIHLCSADAKEDVLGIGAPCIDILFPVEEEFLTTIPGEKGGSAEVDWNTFQSILHYSEGKDCVIATGGSSANTIKGLASLRQSTAFFGKIGNDASGQFFKDKLISLGISTHLAEENLPTTQVAGLITPDGQRTFRYFLGASTLLGSSDLTPQLFEDVKLVHIEGYALYNGALVENALHMAKASGAQVSLDLGSFEVVAHFKDLIQQILPYVDVLFANEDESKAITGFADPQVACQELQKLVSLVVVKVGKAGCWVGAQGAKPVHCPAVPAKVVIDTTGAGDLFAAGFLHGVLDGKSPAECAYYRCLTGSAAVEVFGAEIPEEKWVDLRQKMPKSSR